MSVSLTFEEQQEWAELSESLPEIEAMMNDAEYGTETRRSASYCSSCLCKRISVRYRNPIH